MSCDDRVMVLQVWSLETWAQNVPLIILPLTPLGTPFSHFFWVPGSFLAMLSVPLLATFGALLSSSHNVALITCLCISSCHIDWRPTFLQYNIFSPYLVTLMIWLQIKSYSEVLPVSIPTHLFGAQNSPNNINLLKLYWNWK